MSKSHIVSWFRIIALLLAAAKGGWFVPEVSAQAPQPVGRFMTLTSPINDETIGSVRRTALELQDEAGRTGRDGVLVLEITPGVSQFHHVYALADFLASPAVSGLRTVAWVPESVTGPNALAALTCREVVMTSEATLGDLGRGQALPPEQRVIVLELIGRGGNRLVTTSLATVMADPQTELRQLTVSTADGGTERRLATPEMAAEVLSGGVTISDSKVLKESGLVGAFSGTEARNGGFLVSQLADNRAAVAKLYDLPAEAMREATAAKSAERVALIEIRGHIDTMLASFIHRQIVRAVEADSEVIIFELHSTGGHLNEVRDVAMTIARLSEDNVRTIAWVPDEATGAPALLALGCDEIYLASSAKIGNVAGRRTFEAVNLDDPEAAITQEQQFVMDSLSQLAEIKHRPAAILKAMADPKLRVFLATNRVTGEVTYMTDEELEQRSAEWQRGPVVAESGQGRLSISAARAQQLLVAEPPVESFDDVRHRLGLPDKLIAKRIEKTWVDDMVFTLNKPAITGLLFVFAIVCVYLELHMMSGPLGLVSLLCFALFFWSRFLGGTAGGLEVMLFVMGLGALAMEVLLIPGFGVFGVAGAAMILASLVMASQTFGNIETGRDFTKAKETLTTISYSIVTVIVIAAALSRFLPKIPFLNAMVLTPPGYHGGDDAGPRLAPESTRGSELVGATGIAETVLRPAGKAMIQGRLMNVTSDGPFIPAGRAIEVVQVTGNNNIVVREV